MIVRDEESFLEGCLVSLRGLVDEIVIVDTGSEDRTPAIARSHGARVIDWAWRDDFAAARNVGLDAARSDWLLYIDADERLADTDRASLRAGLSDATSFAARLRFRVSQRSTLYREFRLFRNDPRLRFKGAMHETLRPDLDALTRSIGARVVDVSATLLHLGYDGDMVDKHRRNLPLLQAAIEREPCRVYYWNDLARTLEGLGRLDEAIAVSGDGLAQPVPADRTGRIVRSMLVHTHARLRLSRGEDVAALVEAGLMLYPDNWSLRFLRARARVNAGENEPALEDLALLLRQDGAALCDDHLAHDQRIFGCFAHDLAGVARLRSGDRAGAAAEFARAAALAPDEPSYRVKAAALGHAAR